MDVLARILTGGLHASTPGPADDFWYGPAGGTLTTAGLRIDEQSAQKVSAWFRGRDILATTLAMLPFGMYERLANNAGRDDAPNHPLHDVLHRKPNPWQDSFQWRRLSMYCLIDKGNAYHFLKNGARGFADQLWPLDPTCVTPELLPSGQKMFHVRDPKSGQTRVFGNDQIFHLMGPSDDGIVGKGILERAKDSLGLSLALEGYASTTFSRGAMHGGVIKVPGFLNDEASKRMARSFKDATSGPGSWHMPVVLEQGSEWTLNTMTPEQAQMLLSRKFSVNDIARWLGLPPHMLGDLEKSSFSNIEHQGQEFVTYAEGPWLSLWEFATNDQLVLQPLKYYAEFNRDALVRGDLQTRWQAYMIAVQTGVFTRNEIRVIENKKKLPGLDKPLDPANITGKQPATGADTRPGLPKARPETDSKAEAIVRQSAARVLRKEIAAVQRLAVKHAADGDTFAVAVTEFYAKHVALVVETLQLEPSAAAEYCASQSVQVVAGDWLLAIEQWGTDAYAAGLAGLALESEAA
jgi:HK97 family phage portal protein